MDKAARIHNWMALRHVIAERAQQCSEPITLSSGGVTHSYLDLKSVFTDGKWMKIIAEAMLDNCRLVFGRPPFNTVGGPTMGADFISHSIAINQSSYYVKWFSVRDKPKDHGLQKMIEGCRLSERSKVLLVDDVVSSGNSLLKAYDTVAETGAEIVAVMPIVDRANNQWLTWGGAPYRPLFTAEELGIDPLCT